MFRETAIKNAAKLDQQTVSAGERANYSTTLLQGLMLFSVIKERLNVLLLLFKTIFFLMTSLMFLTLMILILMLRILMTDGCIQAERPSKTFVLIDQKVQLGRKRAKRKTKI